MKAMSIELKIAGANFDSKINNGVALINFWAPWCGPCQMQGPIIEKIAGKMSGKATFGKCNIDEEQELAMKFGIMSIPTLIIFKNGEEVERLIGLHTESLLHEKINILAAAD